jgi:sterol desaturase/sphingolipid hydroxylase (fatty acid hydroxylase superfamily)
MSKIDIDNSPVPIRLFKSDFLEFFTHISPVTVMVIYIPVAVYSLVVAIRNGSAFSSVAVIPALVLLGLFLWTFSEYMLHRFLFHYPARNAWQERISFLMHGVHHKQPRCKTRLVMPPVVSIPLAALFLGAYYLVFGILFGVPHWVAPVFSGFMFGYLFYDLTHYATHHVPIPSRYYRFLKKYHMDHHYKTPDARFGVSSPIWDRVFGTYPAD